MDDDEWYRETQKRAGLWAQLFKPRELKIIQDFIETARESE